MRISAKTDYAIRAASELAAYSGDGWLRTETVAQAQGIPLPFLLNIFSELRAAQIVSSRRGVDGGYRLARPASEVTVADVIRAIDGPLANIAGAAPEDAEYPGAASGLRETWVALRVQMRSVLEAVTLADLASNKLPESVLALVADQDAWRVRQ